MHMHIYGLVQGIFFRANARTHAEVLKVTGWVRNNLDGSVEIVAEGEETHLRHFVDWCHHGPTHAKVEKVIEEVQEFKGEFDRFKVI